MASNYKLLSEQPKRELLHKELYRKFTQVNIMQPIGPNTNNYEKSLNDCPDLSPQGRSENVDPAPGFCEQPADNQNNIGLGVDDSWMDDFLNKKTGLGSENNADPMQAGSIINEMNSVNNSTIYRYSKSIRGTDEAVMDLFRNIVVIDEDGKAHRVPIIWATQERAVAAVVQDNVRKDETLVVDRIKLPILAISSTEYSIDPARYTYHKALHYIRDYTGKPAFTASEKYERDTVFGVSRGIPLNIGYTLYAWTMQVEDMNQILEQILTKFSPIAYIKVRGVLWEVCVKLDSIANNLNTEPGDQALRVVKFQFGITAETYVGQPIRRDKTVLKTKTDFVNSLNEAEISEVIKRLEESVEEMS